MHHAHQITLHASAWLAVALTVAAAPTPAQETTNPLAPFERLIGGAWHLDDGYQVFEWGVGNRSVVSKSYVVRDGDHVLVSEGMWVWHPGEDAIKGYFTAIDMPVDFFDYTTRFDGDTMVNELVSFGQMGGEYRETWEFTDGDHYIWTLYAKNGGELERVMGGTYERR